MDRYRYFIFNQRSMVVLGILQIACAGVTVVCGFMDGAFRIESTLRDTRAPLWAGMIMAVPGVLALFSSQKKNPILKFILGRLVKGANIAMLIASLVSLCAVLCIAYMGCRSLPHCMCYDNLTGMEWLHSDHEQPQTVELVCTFRGGDDRLFNSPVQFTDHCVDAEEERSRPTPYVRFS
ncbi:hypothetical protein FKM82_001305 [Ascaphus truei]